MHLRTAKWVQCDKVKSNTPTFIGLTDRTKIHYGVKLHKKYTTAPKVKCCQNLMTQGSPQQIFTQNHITF